MTTDAPSETLYRSKDLEMYEITDWSGEPAGYRLVDPQTGAKSRVYLDHDDALDAWINRDIEWEEQP